QCNGRQYPQHRIERRISGSGIGKPGDDVGHLASRTAGGAKTGSSAFRGGDAWLDMSRFRVTIDRLVLNGFDARDGEVLVEALQAELGARLVDPANRANWAHASAPMLRLGRVPIGPGSP